MTPPPGRRRPGPPSRSRRPVPRPSSRTPTRQPGPRPRRADDLGGDQVEGRRAVKELLAAGTREIRRLWIADTLDPAPILDEIEELARRRRIRIETVPRSRLDDTARTEAPQGVIAFSSSIEPVALEDLCHGDRSPLLLVVAGVTDPRNLGALLRSAECAGATGCVLPRHRSARLSPTVTKVAAGAIEYIPFAVVGGIPTALRTLDREGFRIIGLAGEARRSLFSLEPHRGPVALVIGGEEKGLARLVRERCTEVVSIPQFGKVPSLNAGAAGAVALFEVARWRIDG